MSFPRYEKYKDSGVEWLGKVPEHWDIGAVKYYFSILDGRRIPLSSEERGGRSGEYPYYGASGIIDWIDEYIFDEDLVLVSEDGANLLNRSTAIAFIAKGKYWVNNHAHILKPVDNSLTYWAERIESIDLTPIITGAAQPKLTIDALKNIIISVPLNEKERESIQRFIIHESTKIDDLIAEQQKLIELLKEKRQAVISHAVTQGLNPNAKMKDSGVEWLGEVPEHWGVFRLKSLIKESLMYGANEAANDDNPLNPRFVRITDIDENNNLRDDTFCSLPHDLARPYLLNNGDVLLARSGATVGKSFIYKNTWGICCFAGYLIRARLNHEKMDANFFFNCCQSSFYWQYISGSQIQSTIQNVSAEKYANLILPCPPLEEQYSIIVFIDQETSKLDTLISEAQKAIALLQEWRTAIISAAVTGKIDVRGFVSDSESVVAA